jgi:hypothetical protein
MAVICVDSRERLFEDTVLGWLYKDFRATAEILLINTRSGKELRLTRQHLVYRMNENSRVPGRKMAAVSSHSHEKEQNIKKILELETSVEEAVYADDIRIGDAIFDIAAHLPDPVVAIDTLVTGDGLYAPLTRSGRLVVDGILVSCYGTYASHTVEHAA